MKLAAAVMLLALLPATSLIAQTAPTRTAAADLDSDGLDDNLEQRLLEKFRPEFMLSESECDTAPAAFAAGQLQPLPTEKNGTIYGQVFPHLSGDRQLLEIHYYHLWSRDCARFGHALDAEYVAALVRADEASEAADRKALYWYAAAHEDTACDGSSGAPAAALGAETKGPKVWISSGKHASFLTSQCTGSCGQDRCVNPSAMTPGALINIGEPGRPLNGAVWAASPLWALSTKMQPEFTDGIVAQLEGSSGIVPVNNSSRTRKGVIRRAAITADALESGNNEAEAALATGSEKTSGAVSTGYSSTKSSLGRAARAVGRWFRGDKPRSAD